jgi:hypothetical protein
MLKTAKPKADAHEIRDENYSSVDCFEEKKLSTERVRKLASCLDAFIIDSCTSKKRKSQQNHLICHLESENSSQKKMCRTSRSERNLSVRVKKFAAN